MKQRQLITTPEERMYKRELEARLKREGRWMVAQEFKTVQLRAFREAGEELEVAVMHAWRTMEEEYPPLSQAELRALEDERYRKQQEAGRKGGRIRQGKAIQEKQAAAEPAESARSQSGGAAACSSSVSAKGGGENGSAPRERATVVRVPPDWGTLPENAPLEKEADWVHANLTLCLERRKQGENSMRLTLAATPAPSLGAVTLMASAVVNPQKFELDVYPKIKGKGAEEESDVRVKEERMAIGEIEGMLERLQEV